MKKLNCVQMVGATCSEGITHIDDKGFIYCQTCGLIRKASGRRCRKLKPNELKTLESGLPLKRY
jgi:hypothetical protein